MYWRNTVQNLNRISYASVDRSGFMHTSEPIRLQSSEVIAIESVETWKSLWGQTSQITALGQIPRTRREVLLVLDKFLLFHTNSTLRKFRYNKASIGELVPLEILGKHYQGSHTIHAIDPGRHFNVIWPLHLVVSSKFYESERKILTPVYCKNVVCYRKYFPAGTYNLSSTSEIL